MTKHEGREERSRHDAGRIICLEHCCIPQLEINELPAVSASRREARQALCDRAAMLHELEGQVETFSEFDVTIGLCVADVPCATWWLIQQGPAGSGSTDLPQAGENTAPRREHLPRPARRPAGGRPRGRGW